MMKKMNFKAMWEIFGPRDVNVLQRFGFRKDNGRPLRPDGKVGPLTRGADYFLAKEAHQPLVSVALAELVMGAQEVPLGRNSGQWVAKYYLKPDQTTKNLGAWCAAFAGWCLRQAYGKDAPYSWSARRLFKRVKAWDRAFEIDPRDAQAGDVIAWSRNSAGPANGHIGIVIGATETHVYVVEGNSGPFVRIFRYAKSNLLMRGSDHCLGVCRIQ